MKLFILILSFSVFSKTKITNIKIDEYSKNFKVSIFFENGLSQKIKPIMTNGLLQIVFEDSYVWPKIEKEKKISEGKVKLLVYQYEKDIVRARVYIPDNLIAEKAQVKVDYDIGILKLEIPRKINIVLDEKYLNEMLVKETPKETFPLNEYIFKLFIFLFVIIALFYLLARFMKKGLFGSKINLFQNKDMVNILNTTYIAPKRSLLSVRVHNQVFLLGNTEKGISLLSEINDPIGILKEGEKINLGKNFDTNVDVATENEAEVKVKVKEDIYKSESEAPQLLDKVKKKFQGYYA